MRKTTKRPTCYVSYCHEAADLNSIEYLIKHHLLDAAQQQIEFIFDRDQRAGIDLDKFMELIRSVDGIILLLTPEYKTKVQNRHGGVYKEFSEIMRRYHELENEANQKTIEKPPAHMHEHIITPFSLIPLIFAGNFERSCPDEISKKLCKDFSTYRAHEKDGKLHITQQTTTKFKSDIEDFVAQILTFHVSRTEEAASSFDEILSVFFQTTKHELIQKNPTIKSIFEQIFVKTYAFDKVQKQSSYILIGRKGSGKSTIVDYLAVKSANKYKEVVRINVNDFNLGFIYKFMTTQQMHAELELLKRVQIFEVVWELFLYVCCMDVLVDEYQKNRLKKEQILHIQSIERFLRKIAPDFTKFGLSHSGAFQWCYSEVLKYMDDAIRTSRNESSGFNYDLSIQLDPKNRKKILQTLITEDCLESFDQIIQYCSRHFLISLDGFDTAFEEFRIQTLFEKCDQEEKQRRIQFEVDWLRGFVHVVFAMKAQQMQAPLSDITDFCVTIPKDRFFEIQKYERDSYIYTWRYYEIRWSAIELVILLTKRLEVLEEWQADKKNKTWPQRLEEILKTRFSYIPLETITTIEDDQHRLPVFIDVLRHTFWRPREILIYFAKIIAVSKEMQKRNMEITRSVIEKCISDTTREIIKTEFLSEFQRHCINLEDIIQIFRRQKQILAKSEVQGLLGGVSFKFIDLLDPVKKFQTQVEFLYKIGFFGLRANKRIKARLKLLHEDVFYFNAGDEPFEVLMQTDFSDCYFIIHPIFCEFLDLDVQKQSLTLNFNWQYLQEQEIHMMAQA